MRACGRAGTHGVGATFCPASREHCVRPSVNATSLPVICSLSSVHLSLQWINGTPVLPAFQPHRFLPRGYKIMNRSVLLFFISVGGGYNKGLRLCFKGLFSFLFVSLLKCFYWNRLNPESFFHVILHYTEISWLRGVVRVFPPHTFLSNGKTEPCRCNILLSSKIQSYMFELTV